MLLADDLNDVDSESDAQHCGGDESLDTASELLGVLLEALTEIADSTTDPRAREVASEALAIFHGR